MDNSMVKRGIGALVLAIIAALLLGWLLKDKSQERQEVMEIKLPNAPEMNIPSLSDTVSNVSDSAATLVGEATDKVTDAGNSVVAAAAGTVSSIKDGVNTATENASASVTQTNGKPGFSIRPSQQNEEKEIVDNTKSGLALITSSETESDTKAPEDNTVVASTKKKVEKFKPHIVNKKKPAKPVKKVAKQQPKKVAKPKKETKDIAKNVPVEKPKPAATTVAKGKYSIQLLATSSQSRANKLAKTMTGEGYKAFITQTTNNDKVLYRVRIGGHADRNAAIKAQEGMKRRYQKNFFVQNSLVVSN